MGFSQGNYSRDYDDANFFIDEVLEIFVDS